MGYNVYGVASVSSTVVRYNDLHRILRWTWGRSYNHPVSGDTLLYLAYFRTHTHLPNEAATTDPVGLQSTPVAWSACWEKSTVRIDKESGQSGNGGSRFEKCDWRLGDFLPRYNLPAIRGLLAQHVQRLSGIHRVLATLDASNILTGFV